MHFLRSSSKPQQENEFHSESENCELDSTGCQKAVHVDCFGVKPSINFLHHKTFQWIEKHLLPDLLQRHVTMLRYIVNILATFIAASSGNAWCNIDVQILRLCHGFPANLGQRKHWRVLQISKHLPSLHPKLSHQRFPRIHSMINLQPWRGHEKKENSKTTTRPALDRTAKVKIWMQNMFAQRRSNCKRAWFTSLILQLHRETIALIKSIKLKCLRTLNNQRKSILAKMHRNTRNHLRCFGKKPKMLSFCRWFEHFFGKKEDFRSKNEEKRRKNEGKTKEQRSKNEEKRRKNEGKTKEKRRKTKEKRRKTKKNEGKTKKNEEKRRKTKKNEGKRRKTKKNEGKRRKTKENEGKWRKMKKNKDFWRFYTDFAPPSRSSPSPVALWSSAQAARWVLPCSQMVLFRPPGPKTKKKSQKHLELCTLRNLDCNS